MTRTRHLALFLPSLLIAGCASVPLSTMWKMRNFDLGTTDVRQLRAAVRTPDFMRIADGKVILSMTLTDTKGIVHADEKFKLVRVKKPSQAAGLRRYAKPGFSLHAFRLSAKDVERMDMFRHQQSLLKIRFGSQLRGSMRVLASGCEMAGHSGQPLAITTYLKAAETGGYIPLTSELDLRKYTKTTKVGLCPSPSN